MSESIGIRVTHIPDDLTAREIRALFNSILTDLAALQTVITTQTHTAVTVGSGVSGAASTTGAGSGAITLNTIS